MTKKSYGSSAMAGFAEKSLQKHNMYLIEEQGIGSQEKEVWAPRVHVIYEWSLLQMYSSSSSSKPRPRLISISEAYRNLATLISQRDVPLKLSLNKDREVVSFIFTLEPWLF